MPPGIMDVNLTSMQRVKKRLGNIEKLSEQAIKRTVGGDFKSRAPSWISVVVADTYGIKKAEVVAAGKKSGKIVGTIKLAGKTVDNVALTFVAG
jgi:hypothetical protein